MSVWVCVVYMLNIEWWCCLRPTLLILTETMKPVFTYSSRVFRYWVIALWFQAYKNQAMKACAVYAAIPAISYSNSLFL